MIKSNKCYGQSRVLLFTDMEGFEDWKIIHAIIAIHMAEIHCAVRSDTCNNGNSFYKAIY